MKFSEKFLGLMKTRPEVVSRETAFLILNPLAGKKSIVTYLKHDIDREAREIMYLVASVHLSVCLHSHGLPFDLRP